MTSLARTLRRLSLVLGVTALVGCSTCDTKCPTGVTLMVRSLMGTMHPGSVLDLKVCFDGDCKTVSVSRRLTPSGHVFLPFSGAGSSSDHTVDVSGPGGLQGHYTGPLEAIEERKGCATCKIVSINISDSGAVQPGVAVTTTTQPQTATTKSGG